MQRELEGDRQAELELWLSGRLVRSDLPRSPFRTCCIHFDVLDGFELIEPVRLAHELTLLGRDALIDADRQNVASPGSEPHEHEVTIETPKQDRNEQNQAAKDVVKHGDSGG